MRILIIKRDKIGDMLLTTPMLRLLREQLPGAEIDVLANTYNAWVLEGNRDVDRVWCYQRFKDGGKVNFGAVWPQIKQTLSLRKRHYDWVIVGNGEPSHRAIQRGLWMGGRQLVAYADPNQLSPRLSHPLQTSPDGHEAKRMAMLLEPLGVRIPSELPPPAYVLPQEVAARAIAWLADHGTSPGQYITLGLGARRAKKQPSTEQIIRWTRHFYEAWGLNTVFMWTPGKRDNLAYPGDDDIAQPVLDAKLPWLLPVRGELLNAIGLIWHGASSIFPDSGLMHFAAASPGGVLGLFADRRSSPSPVQWGPIGPRACYLEASSTVPDLEDAQVFAKIEALIASRPKP